MSPEEFFMYLTIALIVLIPITARLYRYLTSRRVTRMLQEQFPASSRTDGGEKTSAGRSKETAP